MNTQTATATAMPVARPQPLGAYSTPPRLPDWATYVVARHLGHNHDESLACARSVDCWHKVCVEP